MGNILKKYNLTKAQWEVVGGAITGDTLPIGAIIPFGGTEAPTGWLICDGSMLNRETYKELFAAIGTNFGTDGPGNFYIPDLRGKVAVGQDTTDSDFGMGAVGGSKYIQDHQHLGIKWAGANGQNINMNAGTGGVQIEPKSWQGGDGTTSPIFSGKVYGTPTGNSGNLQPYQVTNYIIKAFQSAGVVAQVSNTKSDSTTDTYSCEYVNNMFQEEIGSGTNLVLEKDNNVTIHTVNYKKYGKIYFCVIVFDTTKTLGNDTQLFKLNIPGPIFEIKEVIRSASTGKVGGINAININNNLVATVAGAMEIGEWYGLTLTYLI